MIILEAAIVTSADNSTSLSCGETTTNGSRVAALECPAMPVGYAVDVIVTRNFTEASAIYVHELRVFGRGLLAGQWICPRSHRHEIRSDKIR